MNKNLAYTYGASDVSLLGETIDQNLRRTVEKFPHKEALISVHQNYRVTYTEFYEQVTAVAKGLIALGAKSGDRVGIWSPNCYEWTLLQYATAKIGVIMVNINPAYRTSELIYVINQSGISFIFAAPEFKSSNYKKMIDDAREFTETLRKEVYWGDSWERFLENGKKVTEEKLLSFAPKLKLLL